MFRCGDAYYFDFSLDTQGRMEAHDAAARALKLDPNLSDSHVAMGRFLYQVEWDWKAAEAELRRALALDPFNDIALQDLSDLLQKLYGHSAEALLLAKRAIARDPTNATHYLQLALIYIWDRRLAEAEEALRTALDLSPKAESLAASLASVLMYRGDPVAALAELEREPGERWREALRPQILDALGRAREADSALATFEAKYASVAPYSIAVVYARRREFDHAFSWLDRAYRQREPLVINVGSDLDLSSLRSDRRFKAFLRKMNLPE
jgi:tetratricopeptide (TPR) repeat protein